MNCNTSILDKANREQENYWYRLGNRIAWWDRHQKLWTSYLISKKGNQISDAEYATNKTDFKILEERGFLDTAADEYNFNEVRWNKFAFPEGIEK